MSHDLLGLRQIDFRTHFHKKPVIKSFSSCHLMSYLPHFYYFLLFSNALLSILLFQKLQSGETKTFFNVTSYEVKGLY